MKFLKVVPAGWPCKLQECPPGLFVYNDQLCFKTAYAPSTSMGDARDSDAYNESGEMWSINGIWEDRDVIVQPCRTEWYKEDDS